MKRSTPDGDSERSPLPFTPSDGFLFVTLKPDLECLVHFLHSKLPCVPIKVIRANTMDSESHAMQLVIEGQLIAAVVFKDHPDREFREVKYFCTAFTGCGYGSKVMTELKRHASYCQIYFIVLYASNTATLFFHKQHFIPIEKSRGLSKHVVLPRIEQYQRSTLMVADLVDELNLDTSADWRVGQKILVECGLRRRQLEEAVIQEISSCHCKILVHFKKWASNYDEWMIACASRVTVDESSKLPRT